MKTYRQSPKDAFLLAARLTLCAAALCLAAPTALFAAEAGEQPLVSVTREGLRFNESVLPHDGGLLIANFGSETMRPRPDERKGYILYRKDGATRTLAAADRGLRMPTGMAVKDGRLFVCDAERLVVFNLKKMEDAPQVVSFAPDDEVLNALALDGDTLYVSVTGTDRIYALDVSDPAHMDKVRPRLWLSLPGPNGMALGKGVLYVVSSPHDYANPTADNVIYRVDNLAEPCAEKLPGGAPGVYDGATLSDDGRTLYVSEWQSASVRAVDIASGKTRIIYEEPGIGPADIAQQGGTLYIPDMVGGRVITLRLGDCRSFTP